MNNFLKIVCISIFINIGVKAQTLTGTASFYSNAFNGRKTATGEVFSNSKLTCACNKLALGTMVKVTNLSNNKWVIVKVNDRLAASNKRVVDLSYTAASQLGFVSKGLTKVRVEVISTNDTPKKSKKKKKNKEKDIAIENKTTLLDIIDSVASPKE